MNDKCFFYKEGECSPFTKSRIPIDGLFSKSDLDKHVEHLEHVYMRPEVNSNRFKISSVITSV